MPDTEIQHGSGESMPTTPERLKEFVREIVQEELAGRYNPGAAMLGVAGISVEVGRVKGSLQNLVPGRPVPDHELIARATQVFGDTERAFEWLQEPNAALGGQTPANASRSHRDEVFHVLGRIEHGIIS